MHKQHIYCMYHHTNLYSHLHAISWWVPRPGEVIVVVLCYWISYIEWDENNIVGANKKALNLDGWYIIWLENWRTSYGTTKDYNSSLIIKLLLSTAKERPHINTLVLYPFSILLLPPHPPIPSSYQKYTPLKDNIKQHSIHIFVFYSSSSWLDIKTVLVVCLSSPSNPPSQFQLPLLSWTHCTWAHSVSSHSRMVARLAPFSWGSFLSFASNSYQGSV